MRGRYSRLNYYFLNPNAYHSDSRREADSFLSVPNILNRADYPERGDFSASLYKRCSLPDIKSLLMP